MKYVLKLIVTVSIISLHSGAHADEIGDKATKIYVSFFKSFVSKDIPEVRQKCLKKFINTSTDLQFKQAGAPITSMDKTITLQWLSDSVKNIEFFPNGKLASDFNSTQPIAQLIEFVDKNVCQ